MEALRQGPQRSDAPQQQDAPRWPDAPLRPGSGLADLARLAERIRSSGFPVTIEVDNAARDVPAEVDRAAYRIVQESLTNLLRHGGPGATVRVRIAREAGTLHIEVLDSGRGAAEYSVYSVPAGIGGGGHGIDGMRARAEALGGTLDVGHARVVGSLSGLACR